MVRGQDMRVDACAFKVPAELEDAEGGASLDDANREAALVEICARAWV